jgi:acyl-CoA thioesterase I
VFCAKLILTRALTLGAIAAGLLSGAAQATVAPMLCRAGTENIPFNPDLSAIKLKLARGEPVTIVALGSSSTAGAGASSTDASYPSVLAAELARRLPNVQVKVINRGTGGQRAREMVQRIGSDVVGEQADLVIWQTGSNDAIHDVGIDRLRQTTRRGVEMIRQAGIDVVLMDLQWLPQIDRYPHYSAYSEVIGEVARETGVGHFRRYEVMKAWAANGKLSSNEIIGADGLHMVDASYHCLAVLVGDGIVKALAPQLGKH